MTCGSWLCDSCMAPSTGAPICKNCRDLANAPPSPAAADALNRIKNLPGKIKNILTIGLIVGSLSVLGLTIFLSSKIFPPSLSFDPLRYVPTLLGFIGALSLGMILKRRRSKTGKESITQAQIDALLKADNKLTPTRLAGATNTSVEYAKKVLNALAVEGKLNVSSEEMELVYSKDLLS
jgi:predicted transcriptional regulator